MKLTCQHCATPFREGHGDGAFCCSGCRQVHELINAEDLGDYYALQDRVGRPVGDALGKTEDLALLKRLQQEAEEGQAELTLRVDGMSCLGCVWLVERISRAMPGVRSARVSLQENRLSLQWDRGVFDLTALAARLHTFGYALGDASSGIVAQWSLLTWRMVLSGIFAANAVLLALPTMLGADVSDYANILFLTSLLFVVLSLAVGASHFVLPVLRSWRIGLVHYDSLWVLSLLTLFVGLDASILWKLPVFVFLLLVVRWLHLRIWTRGSVAGDSVVSGAAETTQKWVSLLSLVAALIQCVLILTGQTPALLIPAPLYAFAIVGRYGVRMRQLTSNLMLCVLGWCVVIGFGFNHFESLAWCLLSGLLMFAGFAYWNRGVERS